MTTIYSADGTTVTRRYRDAPRWHWVPTDAHTGRFVPADTTSGYFPLVEADRPSPDHALTVERVGDTFAEVWTFDQTLADANAAAAVEQANANTIDAAISDALAELKQLVEFPDVPNVPGGALTNAQRDQILRELRDRVQQNRNGIKRVAQTLRHTIRYTRGDYDATD